MIDEILDDLIYEIEKCDKIIKLENEKVKLRMYYGYNNSLECKDIINPLFLSKDLIVIYLDNDKLKAINNTMKSFNTETHLNETDGLKNFFKELNDNKFRIEEVYYNEYSEFSEYESSILFGDNQNYFDYYIERFVCDKEKMKNNKLFYVAYKETENDEYKDVYKSYKYWFHLFTSFLEENYLVLEITNKVDVTYDKKVIYDENSFKEAIRDCLDTYKLWSLL